MLRKLSYLVLALALAGPAQAQARKVVLATLEWEPYIGEQLPGHGYACEVVTEAFRSVGYQLQVRFLPWARALEEAREGKADGLFPEYLDEGRKSDFNYSSPFPGGPLGFMARKDSRITFDGDPRKDPSKVLRGLRSYSFGVVRGYINTRAFDGAAYLKKDLADSDEQNLNKLIHRRVDLIVIDKFVARHLIRTQFGGSAGDLQFLEPPLEDKPLYIAFSRKASGSPQKEKDFDEGLARLERTGRLKAIQRQYGF